MFLIKILFNLILFCQIILYIIINNKSINYNLTKVGLCVICKKENLYIQEFIDHYKYLGYNHIFIYDNNDIDGERLDEIIKKEIEQGIVSIINFRGEKDKPQFRAFFDCYEKNNNSYDWLSFFDIDEFLELKPKNVKIQNFLNNKRFKNCQNIKFNWLLFSDDEKMLYDNKPIQERFTTALYNNTLNNHVKSTVRGRLPTNYWKGAGNPHTGINNYNCCSPSGIQISKNSPFNFPYDYKYGFLKHYRTKTIEEYINKMKKGKPDIKIDYNYMVNMFFLTNKKTKKN